MLPPSRYIFEPADRVEIVFFLRFSSISCLLSPFWLLLFAATSTCLVDSLQITKTTTQNWLMDSSLESFFRFSYRHMMFHYQTFLVQSSAAVAFHVSIRIVAILDFHYVVVFSHFLRNFIVPPVTFWGHIFSSLGSLQGYLHESLFLRQIASWQLYSTKILFILWGEKIFHKN